MLIYIHKEQMLDEVERRHPARHYVMVDDKLRILAAMKDIWADRVTTVFPRQGHDALDARNVAAYSPATLTVEHIGDLVNYGRPLSSTAATPSHGSFRDDERRRQAEAGQLRPRDVRVAGGRSHDREERDNFPVKNARVQCPRRHMA